MRSLLTYLCLLYMLLFNEVHLQADIPDRMRTSYGLSIMPVLNYHTSDMYPPKPMSICCPEFREGYGYGLDMSIFAKYLINYNHSLQVNFGYRDLAATMYANQNTILNSQLDTGDIQSTFRSELSMIYFQLIDVFTLLPRFECSYGFTLGINSSKNYSYREDLLQDTLQFDNGTNSRNVSEGALAGINPRYFGAVLGMSYSIPLFNKALFIKPSMQTTFGLRPLQFGTNWYGNSFTFGLTWEYKPHGEIVKPVEIERPIEIDNAIDSAMITIVNNPISVYKEHIMLYEYPILDEIYSSFIEECNSRPIIQDIHEDHGSMLYVNILDTLSRRLLDYPTEILRIQQNEINPKDSMAVRRCLESHLIPVDKIELISKTENRSGQASSHKILSEKLLTPFLVLKNNTVFTHSILGFTCNGPSNDSLQWGVYDSDSELLIKKGLSKINDTIQVHDLPQSFKRGKIRCIFESKGKRTLIQRDITIRDTTIIQFDSIPIEIGVLYDFDSDSLTKRDIEYLKKSRERLNEKDSLIIEAFTDLSGDYEYNKNLAQRRAQAIVQYFSGIPCTIILSPLKKRNSGLAEYQKAYNRIVTITRKMP